MKALIVVLALITVRAFAAADADFESAANQPQVNDFSIQAELDQFRAISQGQTLETQYEIVQAKFARSKKVFERAQVLRNAGTYTEVQFATIYYDYRTLETEMIRLPVEIQKAKLTAEFFKWRVIEYGHPGSHYEAEILATILKGAQAEIQTLNGALALAKTAREMAEINVKHGQELKGKGFLTLEEAERRQLDLDSAVAQEKGIQKQVEVVNTLLASLEKSRGRLGSTANR